MIIQPKQVEVAEIQESLLSKEEYQQFRSIVGAAATATAPASGDGDAVAMEIDTIAGEADATPVEQ